MFDVAIVAIVALLAASLGRRRRRGHAERLVDLAATRPEFADPEGVVRRRLRVVK